MRWEGKDLAHVLPRWAVYFVLQRELNEELFLAVLRALESRAGRPDTDATPEDHWKAFQLRMAGSSRWDMISPRYKGSLETVEDWKQQDATVHSIGNLVRLQNYTSYAIEGIRYTVDLFNPASELSIPYAGAGEPVLALLFEGTEPASIRFPRVVRDRLIENRAFYEILKDLDGLLGPEHVCGESSLFSVLSAYREGRVDAKYRPWDFLFPLHVLKHPPIPLSPETRFSAAAIGMMKDRECTLAKMEDWSGGRALIQVHPGLDTEIAWEYFAVAKALGMIPVQQLVEGSAPPAKVTV